MTFTPGDVEAAAETVVGAGTSPRPSVTTWLDAAGTRVVRLVSGTAMRLVRACGGLPGFATGFVDVDALEREPASPGGIGITRRTFAEPRRLPDVIAGSDPVPDLGEVRTTVSLLDIEAPGYSLRNGHLIDPRRRVIFEKRVARSFPFMRIALKPLERPSHVAGVVACLSQVHNYGHWNLLALPLVDRYRDALGADPDFYYVGSRLSSWQIESLGMLGIPEEKLLRGPVTADRLLVAIADRADGYDSDFLVYADRVLAPELGRATPPTRRLLVSRAGATQRRLMNEQACIAALAPLGVEPIRTERLRLREEIELFRQAELVIGANGAGLTNAVFAPQGAALIELTPSSMWVSQLAQISVAKQLRYGLVTGRPVGLRVGLPATRHDFVVDVEQVVGIVRAALGGSGRRQDHPLRDPGGGLPAASAASQSTG